MTTENSRIIQPIKKTKATDHVIVKEKKCWRNECLAPVSWIFFVGGMSLPFGRVLNAKRIMILREMFQGDCCRGPRLNRESEHQPPDKMVVFSDYRVELIVRSYGVPI